MRLTNDIVLLVDEGNTFTKWAVFENDQLLENGQEKSLKKVFLNKLKKRHPALNTIFLSSVRIDGISPELIGKNWHLITLDAKSKLPFKNNYQSEKSLGADRIALVSAACNFYPKNAVLVVGTGTCVTYNFKDQQNQFWGGAISPGLQMRLDAMATFTAKLPLVKAINATDTSGANTHSALLKGALEGLAHEINGFIDSYKKEYGASLKIMIAGGDALRLESFIKKRIFVEPNLGIYGLLSLYQLNNKK